MPEVGQQKLARFAFLIKLARGLNSVHCSIAPQTGLGFADRHRVPTASRTKDEGSDATVVRQGKKPVQALGGASGGVAEAYQRHYRDILKRQQGGELDLSRVDAMIAVRMRVTGHAQADIEGALRQCAPATRPKEQGRDWGDYAQRTARYAYSAAGDRQAAELGKYRQQWVTLEGRSREPEPVRETTHDRDDLPGPGR